MKGYYASAGSRILAVTLATAALSFATAAGPRAPGIEGTYKLMSRRLADGTVQRSPQVMGLLTYTKTQRNFNVFWKDAEGKIFSYSLVSTYKLTAKRYTET